MHQVVYVQTRPERVLAAKRIVVHAGTGPELQACIACPAVQFRRPDEFSIFMRAGRQQFEQIFSTDNRHHERFRIAIDGGEKRVPARAQQGMYRSNDLGGTWHVLEHLEASHHVVPSRFLRGRFLCGRESIFDARARLELVQARNRQRAFGHIDSGHRGPGLCERLGQNAAAASDVDHPGAVQIDVLPNPVEPQWIDLVQGTEFAFRVPPAGGESVEFGDLGGIDILWC